MRKDGRKADELRPIKIIPEYQTFATGSAMVQWGDTWVLCTACVDESVPPHRKESGGGWLTAEYSMLPGSTPGGRKKRRTGGRESEIQRLIGRSLRAAIDIDKLGPRSITVDCDVIQADGGTRVASITGGYVALSLAVQKLLAAGTLTEDPRIQQVAAVSLGVIDGEPRLDLPYEEDSRAEVDLNLVMTSTGEIIEIQGTGEQGTFSFETLNALCQLGRKGIESIADAQRIAIG